jgi:hypothetical protein
MYFFVFTWVLFGHVVVLVVWDVSRSVAGMQGAGSG